jgi:hypothetical protein
MRNSPVTGQFDATGFGAQSDTTRIYTEPGNVNATTGIVGFSASDPSPYGLVTRFDFVPGADDWYSLDVTASDVLRVETSTPADGPGEFVNNLNPRIELYDPSGALVASGTPMADGRNEFIQYTPLTTGAYRVRVTGEGNTVGEYFLTTASVAPAAQIIDDSDPIGFMTSGEWAVGGGFIPGVGPIGRNANVHLSHGESFLNNVDIAKWTFPVTPGRYRVSATWFTDPTSPFINLWSDAAAYEVVDGTVDGTTVLGTSLGATFINQRSHPNDFPDAGSNWEDLGVFDITDTTLTVRLLTGFNDKNVYADAIRVQRIGELPSEEEVHVTMDGVYDINIPDGSATAANFGTTEFHVPVLKEFIISNQGTAPLDVTTITLTGGAFSLQTPSPMPLVLPGESTKLRILMSGQTPGFHTATVTFGNSDSDEGPYNFTVSGTVLATYLMDDRDPGFTSSPTVAQPGGWGYSTAAGRGGRDNANFYDYEFNRNNPGVNEMATWTFNVTPGQYRVSTTWPFFPGASGGFDDASPFTIFDGTVAGGIVRGGRNINQQVAPDDTDYPAGFGFPPGVGGVTAWERIDVVNITGNTLTVLLQADDAIQFVLADSVLIERLGNIPSGPELVVVQNNRNAAAGTVDFGATPLNQQADRVFTITNSGAANLVINSTPTMTGANHLAFQIIGGPAVGTVVVPGGSVSFTVRLTAAYEGTKNAAISFTTNDSNEGTVNLPITANVLNYRIIDDAFPAAGGYSESGTFGSTGGYQGDARFANSSAAQGPANATWTFTNVTPGIYYVAFTWADNGGNTLYSGNTPVSIYDGAAIPANLEASAVFNQRNAPTGFGFEGSMWQIAGFVDISSTTVTVRMSNAGVNGLILADGVILTRIGGGVPPGNGESSAGQGLAASAPDSPETAQVGDALDEALSAYWSEDLDEVAVALAKDQATTREDRPASELIAAGESGDSEAIDLALTEWL